MPRTLLTDELWSKLLIILLELGLYDKSNLRRTIEGMLAHNPVDMEIAALEIQRAISYLTGISAELGEVFILMDLKGYNQHEAARITGVSGSTVKTRRFQARTYLRDALAA